MLIKQQSNLVPTLSGFLCYLLSNLDTFQKSLTCMSPSIKAARSGANIIILVILKWILIHWTTSCSVLSQFSYGAAKLNCASSCRQRLVHSGSRLSVMNVIHQFSTGNTPMHNCCMMQYVNYNTVYVCVSQPNCTQKTFKLDLWSYDSELIIIF